MTQSQILMCIVENSSQSSFFKIYCFTKGMNSDKRNVGAPAVLSLKVFENEDAGSNPSSNFYQLCNDSYMHNPFGPQFLWGKMDMIKQLPLMFIVRS